jgi:hypothetical protein
VFTKLLGLCYRIVYGQGTENKAADALSRRPSADQVLAVSAATPQWLESVVNSYASDPQAIELITKLSIKADLVPSFTLVNGVLRHKNRVWVGKDQAL